VKFVTDGAKAVERFAAETFDVVLMDIQMPVMNGIDATRLIRAKEAREDRPRTPILALTANTLDHHLSEYAEAGMDGHVAKPVQISSLYAAIATALNA
jgi:CheY-like chemotaxis protein